MRHARFALLFIVVVLLQAACSPGMPVVQQAPLNPNWIGGQTVWRYWAQADAPDANWRAAGLDDSSWAQGRLPLGTDKSAATRLGTGQTGTVYLRTTFEGSDPSAWRALALVLDYQDGAAVYLNGQEIARVNLEPDAHFGDPATYPHDTPADTLDVTPALKALQAGTNVLAVEVHPAQDSDHVQVGVTLNATAQADAAHLLAGPILGAIGKDTVTIKAESDVPAQAVVEYGIADGASTRASFPAATTHTLTLHGLEPGATYHYRLGLQTASGMTWSPDGQWKTDGGAAQSFRFAVWGDSRPRTGSSQPVVFGQLLDAVRSKGPLALAVSVGDNVQLSRGPKDARTVRDRYLGLLAAVEPLARSTPFYSAIGNHDEAACPACVAGWQQYLPLPAQNDGTFYSFDYGPAHFTVLNSQQSRGSTVKAISDAQWTWLQADLEATHQSLKFVFLHDSIYHEAREEDPSFTAQEQDRLHGLFAGAGVTAVFMGHSHYYDYYERDGVAYVITGGAGSPLYDQFVNPNWEKNHALVVDVTPAQATLTALLPDGTVLDQHTLHSR